MIEVTIRQEAERRGIQNPHQLAKNLRIGQSKATRLWEGRSLPKLETLDRICDMWQCDLGALIRCVRGPAQKNRTGKKR